MVQRSALKFCRYKSKEDLQEVFSKAGVRWNQPIITSCGTGVTASVLALGLYAINSSLPVSFLGLK